jgi:hypothetical protein
MILRYDCKYISVMNEHFRNLYIAVYIADCKQEILYWISNWGMNECLQAVCNAIECLCWVMEWQWRLLELYLAAIHTSFVLAI